ncbi:hypothetical protein C4546_05100 [Candidatus Parcubacteria bacterium]|jgi:hypothetical protein|nr:MAG: hypothetical protein C4546_05100 [Candidatus Parcubacteria bacterium]
MRFLRKHYSGKKRTTAIAIYVTLSEMASNANSETFKSYYSQIGEMAGKSSSTIKRYCNDFIKLTILEKKNHKKGKHNLANQWSLLAYSPMRLQSGRNNDLTPNKISLNQGQNNNPDSI